MTCEICQNWAGHWFSPFRNSEGIPIPTNHHPNCAHYNDSLIDVYEANFDGQTCYAKDEKQLREMIGEIPIGLTIKDIKMHKEVFDNLAEFQGF